jgi:hypothetical protein
MKLSDNLTQSYNKEAKDAVIKISNKYQFLAYMEIM